MPCNPFIPKQKMTSMNMDVKTTLGKKPTKGEVGIEIEIEGKLLPGVGGGGVPSPWMYVVDHSLRGQENGEYVLKNPIPFGGVGPALEKLWQAFKDSKSKLDDSNRTSVHVHLNVQDWYFNRLCAFAALYYIAEVPLTQWCGEHRVGNLFCLRAVDAPAQVSSLKSFIMTDGHTKLHEVLHYSALNINALAKYGSLEIRSLRGVKDPAVILDWVETLQRLYELSAEFSDPREICSSLSSIGPLAFFDEILGPKSTVIRSGCNMPDNEIAEAIYAGVRIAQDLCYCRDWTDYKPTKIKNDPFGRSLKTVAKKMQAMTGMPQASQAPQTPQGGQMFYGSTPSPSVEPSWSFQQALAAASASTNPPPHFIAVGDSEPADHWEVEYDDPDDNDDE